MKKYSFIWCISRIYIRIKETIQLFICCDIPIRIIWKYWMGKLIFPHPLGIVIAQDAEIGDGTIIFQNVTIGNRNINEDGSPTIGKNSIIYANSVLIGPLKISPNSVISAMAFMKARR